MQPIKSPLLTAPRPETMDTTISMSPALLAHLGAGSEAFAQQVVSTLQLPPDMLPSLNYMTTPEQLRTTLGPYAHWELFVFSPWASVRTICAERIPLIESVLSPVLEWYLSDVSEKVRAAARARLAIKLRTRIERSNTSILIDSRLAKSAIAAMDDNAHDLDRYLTDPRVTIRRVVATRYTSAARHAWIILVRDTDSRVRLTVAQRMHPANALYHALTKDADRIVRRTARQRFDAWAAEEFSDPTKE